MSNWSTLMLSPAIESFTVSNDSLHSIGVHQTLTSYILPIRQSTDGFYTRLKFFFVWLNVSVLNTSLAQELLTQGRRSVRDHTIIPYTYWSAPLIFWICNILTYNEIKCGEDMRQLDCSQTCVQKRIHNWIWGLHTQTLQTPRNSSLKITTPEYHQKRL